MAQWFSDELITDVIKLDEIRVKLSSDIPLTIYEHRRLQLEIDKLVEKKIQLAREVMTPSGSLSRAPKNSESRGELVMVLQRERDLDFLMKKAKNLFYAKKEIPEVSKAMKEDYFRVQNRLVQAFSEQRQAEYNEAIDKQLEQLLKKDKDVQKAIAEKKGEKDG